MKKYRNRYNDVYYYEPVNEKTYKFVMEGDSMKWCRYGGLENTHGVDYNNLGMFDPSGGPYVALGDVLPIGKVKHLRSTDDGVIIEVE